LIQVDELLGEDQPERVIVAVKEKDLLVELFWTRIGNYGWDVSE